MLAVQKIREICRTECEEHGVNSEFFFNKIQKLYPKDEDEVLRQLDELMYISFHTDFDKMYEGRIPSSECI